jgi:hypothetical protein
MRKHGIEIWSFKALAPVTVGKGGPLEELLPRSQRVHVWGSRFGVIDELVYWTEYCSLVL